MKITIADAMGYIAALLVFMTFWMKTMVPLRLAGLASNLFFIAYGVLLVAYPVLICTCFCCRSTCCDCGKCCN